MAFSDGVVWACWKRAGGQYPPQSSNCECQRVTHDHNSYRCNKQLVWENRGREGRGAWEAHSISGKHLDSMSDCLILCWNCHKLTF
jgi:hypothetical protein